MTDPKAFREGVGKLLAEVQRIKSEGDYAAAKALFETHGIHFDATLRDEIVRVDSLKLPSYIGFVMPKLTAVTGPDGKITDVQISYPMDLTKQMLDTPPPSTTQTPQTFPSNTPTQNTTHPHYAPPSDAPSAAGRSSTPSKFHQRPICLVTPS